MSIEKGFGNEGQSTSRLPKMGRRTAILASIGALIAGAHLFKKAIGEKPVPIPDNERTEESPIRSPYFWTALNEVRKKHPADEGKIRPILERIDEEGIANITFFQPAEDPNLHIPFTKVSVNNVMAQKARGEKEVYIVFTGFANPPAGHPFTPWDIIYDRVINSIPAVSSGKKVDVYCIGYPQGLGGQVSAQWVEAIKDGTEAYGKVYGQFVKKVITENNQPARVILHGISFGSSVAELAFESLDINLKKKIQLLLDNPAVDHSTVSINVLEVPIGFAAEAFFRTQYDPRIQQVMEAEKIFYEKYKQVLSQKGIDWEDSQEQANLKSQATRADVLNMISGTPLDTQNTRSFIRRGILDPLYFPNPGFVKSLKGEGENKVIATKRGRALEFAIGATHFINRYRT